MIPGVNPKQMQKMMKQMGMKQEEIPATRAEIHLEDGTKLVFEEPSITKVEMMGQETYQLTGQATLQSTDNTPEITAEDIQTVMEQTSCTKEEAQKALEDTGGDLAEAIVNLTD